MRQPTSRATGANTAGANQTLSERERVHFEQSCETLRSLNQTMWQIPFLAMTLTGGLWYAVLNMKVEQEFEAAVALFFGFLANTLLVLVIHRVRDVMQVYIDTVNSFASGLGRSGEVGGKNRLVCELFSWMMGVAGVISLVFALLKTDGLFPS